MEFPMTPMMASHTWDPELWHAAMYFQRDVPTWVGILMDAQMQLLRLRDDRTTDVPAGYSRALLEAVRAEMGRHAVVVQPRRAGLDQQHDEPKHS
jgi:hypothetical protein